LNPEISVIMAVYNGQKFLNESIESILSQTFQDFEFIIIDDGSTDHTPAILNEYAQKSPKIRIIRNDRNIGLALSLNKGIARARGKFIARMDADDISLPYRFAKQIHFLKKHSEIWVLGGNIIHIHSKGKQIKNQTYQSDPVLLRWNMLLGYGGILCHPTAMIRRVLFEKYGNYKNMRTSQDLELWSRLFFVDPFPVTNLRSIILYYRSHVENISVKYESVQKNDAETVHHNLLEKFLKRTISNKAIIAFRSEFKAYSFSEIRSYIEVWIYTYKKYLVFFNPEYKIKRIILQRLISRIALYLSINPILIFSKQRLFVGSECEILRAVGIYGLYLLIKYKISNIKLIICHFFQSTFK